MNRCYVSGNLTRDVELRATQGGTEVLTFGIAVNDRKRDPNSGEWVEVPNFIDCAVFGKRAESLSRILHKGSKVAIEGKLRYSSWEAKDGSKRSKLEVVVDEIEFMSQREASDGQNFGGAGKYTAQQQNVPQMAPQQPSSPSYQYYDSSIPF